MPAAPELATPELTAEEVTIAKWKELAEDESLTEETRAAAKENIEQTHAMALALAKAATTKDFERREVQVETALAPSAAARQNLRNWENSVCCTMRANSPRCVDRTWLWTIYHCWIKRTWMQ